MTSLRRLESIYVVGTIRKKYWNDVNASHISRHPQDAERTLISLLHADIEGLRDRGEEGPERKLMDNMGQVHDWDRQTSSVGSRYAILTIMVSVLKAHVSMPKRCDVKVACHLLHLSTAIDAASRSVIDVVVCWTILEMATLDTIIGREQRLQS